MEHQEVDITDKDARKQRKAQKIMKGDAKKTRSPRNRKTTHAKTRAKHLFKKDLMIV